MVGDVAAGFLLDGLARGVRAAVVMVAVGSRMRQRAHK